MDTNNIDEASVNIVSILLKFKPEEREEVLRIVADHICFSCGALRDLCQCWWD